MLLCAYCQPDCRKQFLPRIHLHSSVHPEDPCKTLLLFLVLSFTMIVHVWHEAFGRMYIILVVVF